MTFRPSVLPDRDNDVLSTFVRSFERARQLRRADQADARANAEFNARQEDRQAQRDEQVFQTRLDIARDPELATGPEAPITRSLRQAAGGVTPAGGPDIRGARALAGELAGPERVSLGEAPGDIGEVFFDPGARERTIREDAALQRDLDRPEAEADAQATAQERRDIANALREAGVPEAEIPVLVRNPEDARQRLQSISAQAGRDTAATAARGAGETGGERTRADRIQNVIARAREVGKPVTEAQAAIFADNPNQFQDFLRPIPEARQEQITADLDRMQDVLDEIESDELTNEEKLERKKRALIDGGFLGTAEAFSTGLDRFQAARREAREMAGTFLEPVAQPGAGPAEESGLGGDEPRATINSTQIPAIAAAIEDLNFADRNDAIDRLAPGATANDRAEIMRAAGPAPPTSN